LAVGRRVVGEGSWSREEIGLIGREGCEDLFRSNSAKTSSEEIVLRVLAVVRGRFTVTGVTSGMLIRKGARRRGSSATSADPAG
jgi:hypothetical protein